MLRRQRTDKRKERWPERWKTIDSPRTNDRRSRRYPSSAQWITRALDGLVKPFDVLRRTLPVKSRRPRRTTGSPQDGPRGSFTSVRAQRPPLAIDSWIWIPSTLRTYALDSVRPCRPADRGREPWNAREGPTTTGSVEAWRGTAWRLSSPDLPASNWVSRRNCGEPVSRWGMVDWSGHCRSSKPTEALPRPRGEAKAKTLRRPWRRNRIGYQICL